MNVVLSKNGTVAQALANKQMLGRGVGIVMNSKNPFDQTKNPNTGTDQFSRPIIRVPVYTGSQLDFGESAYTGLKANQVIFKIAEATGGGTGDSWYLFDADGLNGKTLSTGVATTLTSSTLAGASGYTAVNKLWARKHPLVNRIRMSVDAKSQLDYSVTIQYSDDNSNPFDIKLFVPSTAIIQTSYQTVIAEFGLRFAVLPNMVMFGKIDNNTNAGYNTITTYTNDYIYDQYIVG